MSKRSVRAAVSVAVLAGATAVAFQLSTGSAVADEAVSLPLASVGDLVVDGTHQRIFISDPVGGKLITTDYAGKVLNTATGLPGVGALLLDNDRLFAAAPDHKTITTFNRASLAKDAAYTIGGSQPRTLARDGHKIWFGENNAGLGYLDLSGEASVPAPKDGDLSWSNAPSLATSPSRPGVLAVVDTSISPSTLRLLDLTTSPPTVLKSRTFDERLQGLAFNPDGSRILVTGIQNLVAELSPTDLSTVTTYQATDAMPGRLAVRADGAFAVDAGVDAEDAVALYTPGSATPIKQLDLQPPLGEDGKPIGLDLTSIASGTLDWEPGGARLFGVAVKGTTMAGKSPTYSLQVLNDPAKTAVTVQLAVPATAGLNQPYTVIGLFRPAPAGQPMTITRTDASGTRPIGPSTVPAGGSFEFADQQATAGTVSYAVSFAGDDEFTAATATGSVTVGAPKPAALALDRNGSAYNYGATATVTARLGATSSNRVVEIWADPYGNDLPNRMLRKANVDGKGNLTASFKLTRNTTFSAVFRGDTGTAAKTVKSTVSTKASVSGILTRHYKTGKIGATSYQYFRTSKMPILNIAVSPYPNRRSYTEIHALKGGKWTLWSFSLDKLDKAGKAQRSVYTMATGVRFRIRTAYVYNKSGDTVNASTYSTWRYYTVTK